MLAAWVALAAPALASGYDDFARGLTANTRGHSNDAIAAFSSALKSGDLVPAQTAGAYLGRAQAYLGTGDCTAAAADLTTYASLRPVEHDVLMLRARVRMCLGDGTGAKQDWHDFAGADPGALDYWFFARLLWSAGLHAEASDAMGHTFEYAKQYHQPAVVLWYAMTAERAGKRDDASFAKFLNLLDPSDWPMPILKFYLGKMTEQEVMESADNWSAKRTAQQTCEADFYLAEWHLAHSDAAKAKPLLTHADGICPADFTERESVEIELKRLGQAKRGTP